MRNISGKALLIRVLAFGLFGLVNSLTFTVANNLFPGMFVLGNTFLTAGAAAFAAGFTLALVVILVEPVFEFVKIHVRHDVTWALVFLVINTESIWIMGRLANYSGIGLAAFWVAFELGLIVNLLQFVVWRLLTKVIK